MGGMVRFPYMVIMLEEEYQSKACTQGFETLPEPNDRLSFPNYCYLLYVTLSNRAAPCHWKSATEFPSVHHVHFSSLDHQEVEIVQRPI